MNAAYCDICTRWYPNAASGNCKCGGKLMICPGTSFNTSLIQIKRAYFYELTDALDTLRSPKCCYDTHPIDETCPRHKAVSRLDPQPN